MSSLSSPLGPHPTPKSLLPLKSKEDRPLFFVIAIIIFLACVSALITRAAFVSASNWRTDLNGAMTVQIKDANNQAAKIEQARTVLQALPGIASLKVHDRTYAKTLLEPWLGQGNIPDDLPLPVIIALTLDSHAPASKDAISQALKTANVRAEVDDHQRWSSQMNKAAGFLQIFALTALGLLVSAAVAVTGFATRANLAARRDVVNTLHLAGAMDGFIAAQFEQRFGALGLRAGMIGAALAGVIIGGAQLFGAGNAGLLLPVFRLDLIGFALLILAPILTAFAGALTARLTVLSNLKEND